VTDTTVPDITRYNTNPDVVECVIPEAYGHLVYFTDHEVIVDNLLYHIRELRAIIAKEQNGTSN
jgi:hypothetical protein